jgi:3-(3-hydroxy-phenyl)propionate hydroxylase
VIPRIEAHLRMIGERDDWSPIWISLYKANALTANRYVQGRLLLAGDAAHLVPIFGVRGANSGLEDAHALAWRLALVVKGVAPPALLESYSRERVHAARENLKAGIKSTEFMSPPSFAYEVMRTAVLSLAARHPWVRSLINPRQTQAAVYPQDPGRLPAQEKLFCRGPAPGQPMAEYPLLAGAATIFMTQLLAPAFTVFVWNDLLAAELKELSDRLLEQGIPLRVVRVTERAIRETYNDQVVDEGRGARRHFDCTLDGAYLVRPDGHVLARWKQAVIAEINDMIKRELRHD